MKTDFINNMTHEFMTPVTNIGLAIETLERSRQDEDSRRHILGLIAHENNHLRDNVNKVLQVAVMDRGAYDTQIIALDLKALLERVIKSFELVLFQVGGTLVLHAADEEMVICADETHAINLFSNLLDNCIKYRFPGRPLKIDITVKRTGKKIRVSIEDNGNGMDSGMQQHAFTKFYRGSNGNLHDVKGFGLGLSYVKAIADAYQWEIALKSTPGKGTITEITIK
jgi:two-component system phosphate regulon sensor histidine kinase PhoR